MEIKEFRKYAHEIVDWMADFLENITDYPVKAQVTPREIYNELPEHPPKERESMEQIMEDFQDIILPGITHWQSPNFHAYFPGNSSYPSILAEMLTATLGAQCMIWDTSPAAAELEEKMMNWLKEIMELPRSWEGHIQDTASTATLCAILSAREKYSDFSINQSGFTHNIFRVYCSKETHSSIEKAVKIAGIGKDNLVKIQVDDEQRMRVDLLEEAIQEDIENGYLPICVVAATGTTGTTAIDPLLPITEVCEKYNVWLHVDAAYAGTALLLPEYRWMVEGLEKADSFVFNPHKWMFTNFDCTAYFVKDKSTLLNTFSILPEYLKTDNRGEVNDYRDWGIPLGRRFRALKLWFVIRTYGVNGLQKRLREHIDMAKWMEVQIENHPEFEIIAKRTLNAVFFRYRPNLRLNDELLNDLNAQLLKELNNTGEAYMTHTKVGGIYTIRMVIGQTYVQPHHIENTWGLIQQLVYRT